LATALPAATSMVARCADTITANSGNNDTLLGGPGQDSLKAQSGNCLSTVARALMWLKAGSGNDTLHGNKGLDASPAVPAAASSLAARVRTRFSPTARALRHGY